jgi:hypothetical protein
MLHTAKTPCTMQQYVVLGSCGFVCLCVCVCVCVCVFVCLGSVVVFPGCVEHSMHLHAWLFACVRCVFEVKSCRSVHAHSAERQMTIAHVRPDQESAAESAAN